MNYFSEQSNLKKYLLTGSLAAIYLGGIYYYYTNKKKKQNQFTEKQKSFENQISKEKVIKVMKDLKTQYFQIYFTLAEYQQKLMNQTLLKQQQIKQQMSQMSEIEQIQYKAQIDPSVFYNMEELEEHIYKILQPELVKIFQQKEIAIFTKHDVSHSLMKQALNNYYKNDPVISKIQSEIFFNMNNCLRGIEPNLTLNPAVQKFMTEQKSFECMKLVLQNAGNKLHQLFKELKIRGETNLSFDNLTVSRKIAEIDLYQQKTKILHSQGLNQFGDESPSEILAKACIKYRKDDDSFSKKLEDLDNKHDIVMDALQDPNNQVADDFVDKVYADYFDVDKLLQEKKEKIAKQELKNYEKLQEDVQNQEQQKSVASPQRDYNEEQQNQQQQEQSNQQQEQAEIQEEQQQQ